jgi:methyl-accepting chemotaxis protein
MKNLTLKMKLGLGFGSLLLIITILGVTGYESAVTAADGSEQAEAQVRKSELAGRLETATEKQVAAARAFLLTGSEEHLKSGEIARDSFDNDTKELGKLLNTPQGLAALADIQRGYHEYRPLLDRAIQLRRAGETKAAVDLIFSSECNAKRSEIRDNLAKLSELISKVKEGAQAEQNLSESRTKALTLIFMCLGLLLGLAVAMVTARSITRAIARMLVMIEEIAHKNLTVEDLPIDSTDAIGRASLALNEMKSSLHSMMRSIAGSAVQVASASEELNATSQQITANSEETSAQADVVSKAAQTVSQNLQTVATGAEEMGASIKEIAKNATEAAKVATGAVRVAETTTATVSKLGDSSTEIGQVIKVITSIAQQTNLLALNATIEAARAGEAGKGFAVVANEVKELAKETAKATEDISRKIEAIQTDTKAAVEAIASISGVINQINDISGTIATAVEEQNATTNEMSRNVSEAAQGSGEITSNIAGVAEAAQGTTRGATDTQKASQQLVETSNQLRHLVQQFKIHEGGNGHSVNALSANERSRSARAGA